MFPCLSTPGNIVAETKFASREAKMFPDKFRNIFVAETMFPSLPRALLFDFKRKPTGRGRRLNEISFESEYTCWVSLRMLTHGLGFIFTPCVGDAGTFVPHTFGIPASYVTMHYRSDVTKLCCIL